MEEITPLLKELAAQLNTTVDFLWGVLIRQASIYALTYVIHWILVLCLIVGAYKLTKFTANNWDEDDGQDFALGALCTALWVGVAFLFVNQLLDVSSFVTALLNPEYWALQQILVFIR